MSSSPINPAGLIFEPRSLLALHVFQAVSPQVREELQGIIECLRVCPAIPSHKVLNAIKEVLHFIPSLCVVPVSCQVILREVVGALSVNSQFPPTPTRTVRFYQVKSYVVIGMYLSTLISDSRKGTISSSHVFPANSIGIHLVFPWSRWNTSASEGLRVAVSSK